MRLFPALLLATVTVALRAASPTPETPFDRPLRDAMPPETFAAAGLEKLSPAELQALEAWLRSVTGEKTVEVARRLAQEEVKVRLTAEAEKQGITYFEKPTDDAFKSRFVGEFKGFRGKGMLIGLENGQVWRLADEMRSRTFLDAPLVEVWKGRMGGYWMRIEGTGASVNVIRVK